ncbi:MAG TPA: DUF1937 family protein [Stellaceae bacterium]|jgi:hypothetical protein|nr:DUF1937 family protein [Stellaceae bacterium]
MPPIIYLASPYTDTDPAVRLNRFNAATKAAARLIKEGRIVYSPITMTHPLDLVLAENGATLGSDYWVAFDEAFMECCTEIVILRIDGWEQSKGIAREREFFQKKGRLESFIDP